MGYKEAHGLFWGVGCVQSLINVNTNQHLDRMVVKWIYIYLSELELLHLNTCVFYCKQFHFNKADTKRLVEIVFLACFLSINFYAPWSGPETLKVYFSFYWYLFMLHLRLQTFGFLISK